MKRDLLKIAITGGIGCGKSVIREYFEQCGFPTADADKFAHELYSDSQWLHRLTDRWGTDILQEDGSLDRRKLGEIVFASPAELATLNSLVHPEVRDRIQVWLEAQKNASVALVEVPLLFESGWQGDFDRVLAVWSPEEMCCARVVVRGWSAGEYARRSSRQWSAAQKLEAADWGIINLQGRESAERQCDWLIKKNFVQNF